MLDLSRRSVLAAGGMAIGGYALGATGSPTGIPGQRFATLDRLLTQLASLAMFNGVVTIDIAGRIVFERSYGFADYGRRTAFTHDTRFKVASISKPMTDAALAAMLVRGALRLDDPLSRFLPWFPHAERISIELITRHRSGIPHTNTQPWGEGPERLGLDEILQRLAKLPLDFEPGTARRYSNGGYAALARVLEIVTAKPYPQLMQELVFSPLHMSHSGAITDSRAPPPHLALGYIPGPETGSRSTPRPYLVELRPGGGSLFASARDVMRFFQASWARAPSRREGVSGAVRRNGQDARSRRSLARLLHGCPLRRSKRHDRRLDRQQLRR